MNVAHTHYSHRSDWLRAGLLGANDGIVSTASLLLGVIGAGADSEQVIVTGIAGLIAGGMSMATGEYVSVSSQRDTIKSDLEVEKRALDANFVGETEELSLIYQERGLCPELANQVAIELMNHDALGAHARDDIGISDTVKVRPLIAAVASFTAFTAGGCIPLLGLLFANNYVIYSVASLSALALIVMGAIAAKLGGSSTYTGALRMFLGGAAAMLATWFVGNLFGVVL